MCSIFNYDDIKLGGILLKDWTLDIKTVDSIHISVCTLVQTLMLMVSLWIGYHNLDECSFATETCVKEKSLWPE